MISEFVEKLRDRLKKELQLADEDKRKADVLQFDRAVGYANGMAIAIDILNQLAEEYKDVPDTNVGKWIPVSEKLPEEKFYDDGYVEPSDTVLVFTKYGSCKVSRYWGNRRNKRDYYDWVDIDYRKKEVLAWQPLPEPYKGE